MGSEVPPATLISTVPFSNGIRGSGTVFTVTSLIGEHGRDADGDEQDRENEPKDQHARN